MQKHYSSKQVSVVTVTYNSAGVIARCLDSVPEDVAKIYVVDNASTDDTYAIAHDNAHKPKIIRCEKNLGFGRANNVALQDIKTEFALLLNPDTVMEPQSLEHLLLAAQRYPEAAIIAPALYNNKGEFEFNYRQCILSKERGKNTHGVPDADICAEHLSGAVMLLRMACFKDSGFFDDKIFLFYEDDDLCLKARRQGYELVLTPAARMTHLRGQSSVPSSHIVYLKNWHMMWSRLYLERKYKSDWDSQLLAVKLFYISAFKTIWYALMFNLDKMNKSFPRTLACVQYLLGKQAVE